MKALILSLFLLTSSECQIAVKIAFPTSEYSKKHFNELSMYNIDNWTKSFSEIKCLMKLMLNILI